MTKKEEILGIKQEEQQEQQKQQEEQQVQEQQTESAKLGVDKLKELESLYNQRLQELSLKEKELEPLIQLQKYLEENPDKAQKISKIIAGQSYDDYEEEIKSTVEENIEKETDEIQKLKKSIEELKSQIEKQKLSSQVEKEKLFLEQKIKEYEKMYDFFDPQVFIANVLAIPENHIENLSDLEYQKLLDNVAKTTAEYNKQKFEKKYNEYISKKKEISEKTKSEVQSSPVTVLKKEKEKITFDNSQEVVKNLLKKFLG